LVALVLSAHPDTHAIAVDFSPAMLEAAEAFAGDSRVSIIEHNMDSSLPDFGSFDAVISSFGWLRKTGFVDVDCQWKWRELALLVGVDSRTGERGSSDRQLRNCRIMTTF
jgi:hypothetical protein